MISAKSPVVAIVNAKGGAGKTTTAIHLAVALADRGYEVLAIDADMQHPLTRNLGVDPCRIPTLKSVLLDDVPAAQAAVPARPHLRLIPASLDMADMEIALAMIQGGDVRLRDALESRDWDICLIDCPPNLGKVTLNALTAADYMLVPVDSALWGLQGLDLLMDTADNARRYYNRNLRLLGIVLTRASSTNVSKEIREAVRRRWPKEVMSSVIRNSVRYQEAVIHNQTIFDTSSTDLHADYLRLADEVLERVGGVRDAVAS